MAHKDMDGGWEYMGGPKPRKKPVTKRKPAVKKKPRARKTRRSNTSFDHDYEAQ